MTTKTATFISLLTGLGMIFIGTRFLLSPEIAEEGYGIRFNQHGDYSFHYIKGIRDLYSGIIICLFFLTKQPKALGITMLAGTMIPFTDMLIVTFRDYNGISAAIPHLSAMIVCAVSGGILLFIKPRTKKVKARGFIKLISTVDTANASIMELNILPGEKTPWHYHTLFSETFEIVKGTLEVGKGKSVLQLRKGETATITPNEKHYYHNISEEECIIKVMIKPGDENFRKALFILKGLSNDGLSSKAGIPCRFKDLAVFIYLSNSRMSGVQKIAEPVFGYVAKRALKKGYLDKLVNKYTA